MIKELLENKTIIEKANIKADEIVKLDLIGKYVSKEYSLEIEIKSVSKIEGGVELMASAWKDGKPLGLGVKSQYETERFKIYNPPILIADENGDIIQEWVDEKTQEIGQIKFREDASEALRASLAHTIYITIKENEPTKGSVGNTTSTFYPAAGNNTPVDGQVQRDLFPLDETLSDLRSNAGTGSGATANPINLYLISGTTTDEYETMYRIISGFDTSSIGTDVVDSAVYSLFGVSVTDNFDQSIVIDRRVPASTNALVAGDYNIAGWAGIEQASNRIDLTSFTTSGYNDFTLNATGEGNVNTSGLSWFGARLSSDFDNSAPTWALSTVCQAVISSADNTGTTQDPKLVVVHSAAVVANSNFFAVF